MSAEPKPIKPKGADEFVPDSDEEIAKAAEVTPERIEDAKRWLRSVAPEIADELESNG